MSEERKKAHDERRNTGKRARRSSSQSKRKARDERELENRRQRRAEEDEEAAIARHLQRNDSDRDRRAKEDEEAAAARRLERLEKKHSELITPTFDTSIDDLRDPSKLDFVSFEQNPETAVILWELNRGLLQFPMDKDWSKQTEEEMIESIRNEKLMLDEVSERIEEYRNDIDPGADLLTCGACGIRGFGCVVDNATASIRPSQEKYYRMNLDDLEILLYNEEYKNWYAKIRENSCVTIPSVVEEQEDEEVDVSKVISCFKRDDGRMYHLHPEFIETVNNCDTESQNFTVVCEYCHKSIVDQKVPKLSIANGVDFGDFRRVGLNPLSSMERLVVAKVRMYNRLIKVTRPYGSHGWNTEAMQGHHILFQHESPEVAEKMINEVGWHCDDISKCMRMNFVGVNKDDVDQLIVKSRGCRQIVGNTRNIYRWLAVLGSINPLYKSNVDLISMKQLDERMNKLLKDVIESPATTTTAR